MTPHHAVTKPGVDNAAISCHDAPTVRRLAGQLVVDRFLSTNRDAETREEYCPGR